MVKPGGTGRPRLAISARLAPLPPSRSRRPALPSALPSPNVYTHLPDLAASGAPWLAAGFGAGLAGLFFSALRAVAGGAALARTGADGFDFAAVFLAFATALAMTYTHSARGDGMRALHHVWAIRRKLRTPRGSWDSNPCETHGVRPCRSDRCRSDRSRPPD